MLDDMIRDDCDETGTCDSIVCSFIYGPKLSVKFVFKFLVRQYKFCNIKMAFLNKTLDYIMLYKLLQAKK